MVLNNAHIALPKNKEEKILTRGKYTNVFCFEYKCIVKWKFIIQ